MEGSLYVSSNISNQTLFLLKLVGFSGSDEMVFESILSLADNRLEKSWQITLAKDNIDFFVLSNQLRSQIDQDKLLQTLPREKCVFCALELSNDSEHELLVDKNNIPFLGPMVELFNKLSSHQSATKNAGELDGVVKHVVSQAVQESRSIPLVFFESNKHKEPKQADTSVDSQAQVTKSEVIHRGVSESSPKVKPRFIESNEIRESEQAAASIVTKAEMTNADDIHKTISESSIITKPKSLGFFEKFTRSNNADTESVSQEFLEPHHQEQDFSSAEKPINTLGDQNSIYSKQESERQLSDDVTGSEDNIFDPASHPFISRLLDNNTKQNLFFSLFNTDELYVDLQHKCYYSAHKLEGLQVYFTCQGKFFLQNLTDSQLQTIVSQRALKPQPLNNLLWYAVFSCSQGNMIVDYQTSDIVRLKRWPDINLPGSRKLIKLAAYMHSNSVNLQTIQAETKFPIAAVRDFYNACKVIGLIGLCQETDVHKKAMDNGKRELYAKIGKRIKSIS